MIDTIITGQTMDSIIGNLKIYKCTDKLVLEHILNIVRTMVVVKNDVVPNVLLSVIKTLRTLNIISDGDYERLGEDEKLLLNLLS